MVAGIDLPAYFATTTSLGTAVRELVRSASPCHIIPLGVPCLGAEIRATQTLIRRKQHVFTRHLQQVRKADLDWLRPARRAGAGRRPSGSPLQVQVVRGLLALIAVLALLPLAACGAPTSVNVDASTVIIDVRTPAEYSAGHLESATLLDLNSGQFQESLGRLDPDTSYLVYCRSGNRSGQAVAMMAAAGFSNVTDLGAISDASKATGLEIVTG